MTTIPTPRRRRRTPIAWMAAVTALVAGVGAFSVVHAANTRTAEITRVDALDDVLDELPVAASPSEYPAINYLLVGSDSRENIDPSDPDYGAIGRFEGRRSDTIMILRQEANGGMALTSLPRDLWVEIAGAGHRQRINTAYSKGPDRLAATVSQSLGIPVHHFIEVDLGGFKEIVDRLGGVEICTNGPARDPKSQLDLPGGCQVLDGISALAYARSRTYEEWDGSKWVSDPRADLGRIERQQTFIRAAGEGMMRTVTADPYKTGDLISAVIGSVRVDSRLDPFEAADTLRAAMGKGLRTYALPVYSDWEGNMSILRLGDGADKVFAYFRGEGPPPTEFETTTDTEPATG